LVERLDDARTASGSGGIMTADRSPPAQNCECPRLGEHHDAHRRIGIEAREGLDQLGRASRR
jgi:hypothetical protein